MSDPVAPATWWYEYRQAIATLAGVVIGFCLPLAKEWWTNRRRRKAHWAALETEAEICREHADIYLADQVAAPSYRLPTRAFENSLPPLLAAGQLGVEEFRVLTEFFLQVETFNRGLDQVNEARGDVEKLNAEYGRNRLKAARLTVGDDTLYTRARQVLVRRQER